MVDYDAIIIGGGPAGLTAGLYLSRAQYQVLLLEKNQFGGNLLNIIRVENYPGFSEGCEGATLAAEMISQAVKYGLELVQGEVVGIDTYSSCFSINCDTGAAYTAFTVIIAGGTVSRKLNVLGEDKFQGRGVIHCALCDGGEFKNRILVVCGGGDAGITEAIYMARLASKVIVVEPMSCLTATPMYRTMAAGDSNIEIRCGQRVVEIFGDKKVKGTVVENVTTFQKEAIEADGVLVRVGAEPNTAYLEGVVPLDVEKKIIINQNLETDIPGIFAAGDLRQSSPTQISSAVGDGAIAAIAAQKFLQALSSKG